MRCNEEEEGKAGERVKLRLGEEKQEEEKEEGLRGEKDNKSRNEVVVDMFPKLGMGNNYCFLFVGKTLNKNSSQILKI